MTLKEIAEKAGVSVATVSYVLNDSPKVGEATKKRVEQIIKETGYQSNFLAQSLRRNKTSLIGVVVEDITVTHTPMIIDGINDVAEKRGYQIVLNNLRLLSKIESQFEHISKFRNHIDRAVETLGRMQVDGIMYVGMHDRLIKDVLHDVNRPVVYCYCYTTGGGSSVHYSNEKEAYQITKEFLKKGHRNFGVIKGSESSEPCVLRMKGVERALKEAGVELKPENVINGDYKYRTAYEASLKLLRRKDHPEAIIAVNDEMAVGCRDAARELGLAVPEDISLSGFDNADIIRYITPKITTVERPLREMGARGMTLLLDKIEKGTIEDADITLPCRIIRGESIKDLRKKD